MSVGDVTNCTEELLDSGWVVHRVLLQTEAMRIAAINEGRMLASLSGAKAAVGRGYDIATDRIEECVLDFSVRPVGRVAAPSFAQTQNTRLVGAVGGGGGLARARPGNANGAPSHGQGEKAPRRSTARGHGVETSVWGAVQERRSQPDKGGQCEGYIWQVA